MTDLACLAIHYQNDVIHEHGRIKLGVGDDARRRDVIAAAGRVLKGVRGAGIPVVSVRIAFRPDHRDVIRNCPIFRNVVAGKAMAEGSWGTEFHAGLGPEPGEFVVTHSRINGFFGSPLEQILTALGTRRLIVAGVATNSSVEHTVRHAVDIGYEVSVASDACSVADARLHQASLDNMALLAEILTVDEILNRLG